MTAQLIGSNDNREKRIHEDEVDEEDEVRGLSVVIFQLQELCTSTNI